jgi:type I restriction enzyme S subunit
MLLDQVLPLQRGASYPAVGDSDVKQATIPLPDLDTQRGIAATLDSVVGTIKSQKGQLQSIIEVTQTLRRSLLHKAFTGELLEGK